MILPFKDAPIVYVSPVGKETKVVVPELLNVPPLLFSVPFIITTLPKLSSCPYKSRLP